MPDQADEARRIFELCQGDALRAFQLVDSQLAILVLRTQVMLTMSGIVITVTGFSGRAIAETSVSSRICVVSGLFLVLLAAAIGVSGVLRVRWLTQALEPDPLAMLRSGLALRDRKARSWAISMVVFVIGFALYCAAVAQLLLMP